MTWVKICGVNKPEDIRAAEEAGADALGMVLAPSPRQLAPQAAARLSAIARLPVFLVTVDTPWPQLRDWANQIGAQGVQPHGLFSAEASSSAARAGLMVLRPVPVREKVNLADIPEDQTPLLDTYHPDQAGGTGQRIPPEKIPPIERRWVLAGGLNPTNITQALAELSPPGVDVSSGVEAKPGEKDPDRIYAFVQAVRSFRDPRADTPWTTGNSKRTQSTESSSRHHRPPISGENQASPLDRTPPLIWSETDISGPSGFRYFR